MNGHHGQDGAPRDPLVGTVVNRKFHIQRAIAKGGMGRIYYATQAPLDRPVALKVVSGNPASEHHQQFLKRFLLEASILAKLQHPNIVTLFDYGPIERVRGEQYFIAMEFLAGETLAQRLKDRGVLAVPDVLFLLRQIARGLREAHAHDIVHRDLKPSNIMLVPDGDGEIVKLVDFGIGKVVTNRAAQDTSDLTEEGAMVGTPRYMAPEQFEGVATPASDIYALGTIVYQALSGAVPFHGKTLAEFMVAKFAHAVPPIRAVNPHAYLPASLEGLVLRMLARAPEQRPTIEDLFAHLARCEQEVFGASQSRPSATGTGRHDAISATPWNDSGSKVPPTIVAPMPRLSLHTAGQMTPRPISTSTRPESGIGGRVFVALAVAIGTLAGAGILVWTVQRSGHATPTSAENLAPSAAKPEPAQSANAAESATFTFVLHSTPAGANVLEHDRVLGTTPFQMSIERASVKGAPRTFLVKKDGFIGVTVVQGSSSDAIAKQTVTLSAEPPVVKAKAHGSGGRRSSEADIRLTR